MKILIIDHNATPYSNELNKGGVETIVKMQLEMLCKNNQVFLYTSSDSNVCSFKNVTTYKSSEDSKLITTNTTLNTNKIRKKELVKLISDNVPDIIINHNQSNNSLVKFLTSIDIPSITYCHNPTAVIGGIAGLGYIETLSEYFNSGGLVVNVSNTSMDDWITYHKKYGKSINPFNIFQHSPVFFEKPIVQKCENYGLMATRMFKSKRIHTILNFHKQSNLDFKLCYIAPRAEDEFEYFETLQKLDYDNFEKYEDLPRDKVIDMISKSSYMVVAGPESLGLSALEANLYGVPVVLYSSSEIHPVVEMGKIYNLPYAVRRFHTLSKKTDFFSLLDEVSYENRVELSETVYEYFKFNSSYKRMVDIIEIAIDRKKSFF